MDDEELARAFSGARDFDVAMGAYQSTRDEHVLPIFEFTCQLATLEPPPPEMQQLLGALIGNQAGINQFMGTINGTVPLAAFYAPENMGRLLGAAV